MGEPERRDRQHAQSVAVDQEWVLVGAVIGAAILDDTQPPRGDFIAHPVIEQHHGIRDVLLEPLTRQALAAPLARDDGSQVSVLEPTQEPAQLRTQDVLLREPAEERLNRIEDHDLRTLGRHGVIEPDEQGLEVVFARLLDLAAIDVDVINKQLSRRRQLRQVEPERGHIAGEVACAFLEAHEDPGLAETLGAVDEEAQGDERFAGAWTAAYERRTARGQAAPGDLIETVDPR